MRDGSGRCDLITGGAGFIGSHLASALASAGRNVIVIDDLSTGCVGNVDSAREEARASAGAGAGRIELLEGEVSQRLPDVDASAVEHVYHLAAAVGVRLVVEDTVRTIETNVRETSAALEFARAAHLPVLVASTSEVYGKSTRLPLSEEDDVTYGPTSCARWSYALSKAIDESLAIAHHRQHGVRVVIARFFNTVGPRQTGRYGMVLPRMVESALAGRAIEVHGDGEQSRTFCDVRDVVPALPRLLALPSAAGRAFNIGRDERITMNQLAQRVIEVTGSGSRIVHRPYADVYGPGFEDLRMRQPDLRRVRCEIGWSPAIPLERTIADIAAWHRSRLAPGVCAP
jgi:UDP-glucose 4-epimerase